MLRRLRYVALGAALAYFFDPENGGSRRESLIKRLAGLASRRAKAPQPAAQEAGEPPTPEQAGDVVEELAGKAREAQGREAEDVATAPGETAPVNE